MTGAHHRPTLSQVDACTLQHALLKLADTRVAVGVKSVLVRRAVGTYGWQDSAHRFLLL